MQRKTKFQKHFSFFECSKLASEEPGDPLFWLFHYTVLFPIRNLKENMLTSALCISWLDGEERKWTNLRWLLLCCHCCCIAVERETRGCQRREAVQISVKRKLLFLFFFFFSPTFFFSFSKILKRKALMFVTLLYFFNLLLCYCLCYWEQPKRI